MLSNHVFKKKKVRHLIRQPPQICVNKFKEKNEENEKKRGRETREAI